MVVTYVQVFHAEYVAGLVVAPICLGTFGVLLWYTSKYRQIWFYWRLFLALAIMFVSYVLGILVFYYYTPIRSSFMFYFVEHSWQIKVFPTLLYAWQYFDVVEAVYKQRRPGHWTRIVLFFGLFVLFMALYVS